MAETPDSQSLEAILRRAAGGEEAAWRVIVEVYTPRVYGLVRAHCGRGDLAEEITQSTFCTIVEKLPAYAESGKFESWLFRIAMNRLRDEMRRRKRHAASVEDETLTGLAESAGAEVRGGAGSSRDQGRGGDEAIEDEDLKSLDAAMSRLAEPDRRILHLRHVAELSFKQIADVLDQPVGTVLARHHRALKKLRDLMSGGEAAK